ncbi:MAG TPA: ATP-dependent DNA helicase UvrD2 [Candidatus Limnocylindrales bacterium]|nr:ATP-dependent DNA helicase UvrD2 [Candidatus Limnocylindrales bacterium]
MTATPDRLLDGLNDAQREAVSITSGPLAIVAGAGSGKTRVISRRAAYAIETGAVRADRVLLVTFTDRAAGEMVERMAALGHRGVMARTFHSAAFAQLRHFWPSRHDSSPAPRTVESKFKLLVPLANRLPGGYRFTQLKDLADAIEWAKVRRIRPEAWVAEGGDRAPIPAELFARLYADYERTKSRAGLIDFEDMLVETVDLLERDPAAAALVRSRKSWFSVDEYQDTNPLAERLLELWLGESRDVAVVGDPDQTIYTFTGATPGFLLGFGDRHPGARTVALVANYRSTPQILTLANRLIAPGPRGALVATSPPGPAPVIRRFEDDAAELAHIAATIPRQLERGTAATEIAILVRLNAQLPEIEQTLTRAAIPFRVRGQRFFDRPEVREARRLLRRGLASAPAGMAVAEAVRALFAERLGFGHQAAAGRPGDDAREREASLELLLDIVDDLASRDPGITSGDVLAELDRRDADEAAGSTSGVNLLTYHRAKGLEWDVVYLPALEEGLLPFRQAKDDDAVAEERRLLYVGITRARRELILSWAARRAGASGREGRRAPSRFLAALEPRSAAPRRVVVVPAVGPAARPKNGEPGHDGSDGGDGRDDALLAALHGWRRERARSDAVPAYVVAHDATLAAIAEARPTTLAALRRVRGMGPAKLEHYGPDILALVARIAESV